jgi:hypothetical protein
VKAGAIKKEKNRLINFYQDAARVAGLKTIHFFFYQDAARVAGLKTIHFFFYQDAARSAYSRQVCGLKTDLLLES